MESNAFVTGADRGLGLSLCAGLLEQGWQVFAGQYMPAWPDLAKLAESFPYKLHAIPLDVASMESVQAAARIVASGADHLDLLINNAGVSSPSSTRSIREPQDYAEMHRLYDVNTLGPLRMVEAFLPLLDQGEMKRLCFVSSEAGSIQRSTRTAGYGYSMSKAALNMAVKILFNQLRPAGYTFRLYHPGWMRTYMSGAKSTQATFEPEEAAAMALPFFLGTQADEDSLALIDNQGEVWPW